MLSATLMYASAVALLPKSRLHSQLKMFRLRKPHLGPVSESALEGPDYKRRMSNSLMGVGGLKNLRDCRKACEIRLMVCNIVV